MIIFYIEWLPAHKAIPPITKNTTQDKCLPRVKMSGNKPETTQVTPIMRKVPARVRSPRPACKSSAANPIHPTVVICQAKRRVRTVKSVLPNIFGRLSRRNRRIRIYFSPRNEWAIPRATVRPAAKYKSISISTPNKIDVKLIAFNRSVCTYPNPVRITAIPIAGYLY